MNSLYLIFKKYLILSFFVFIFAVESLFAGPGQSSDSTNHNSDSSSTTDTSGDGGNYSSGYTRSKYSSVRKRKFTKVKEIVDSYPNLKTYLENNQIPVEKLSYSDLEKTISDMKFQTLNSQRSPATVISTNSSAISGPSCLPQIVEVKTGTGLGTLSQVSIPNALAHNEEKSYSCDQVTGSTNFVGRLNLKCSNAAMYVTDESSCTYGGCSTSYSGFKSTNIDNSNPVNDIVLRTTPTPVGQTVQKSCSEIYQSRNIANVRGTANFTCATGGWQVNNNCEIRACEDVYTFALTDQQMSYCHQNQGTTCTRSMDLASLAESCIKAANIDKIKISFKHVSLGNRWNDQSRIEYTYNASSGGVYNYTSGKKQSTSNIRNDILTITHWTSSSFSNKEANGATIREPIITFYMK